MKTLSRYIAGEVIKGSLIAVLILLVLLNFFTFADELGDLGQGNYGLANILQYLILTSPRNFYELMPSAALVGSLVTLGALANNRELVAMQAAGVSRLRIIAAVLAGGMMLVLISLGIGEYIAPVAERAAHTLKATALKKQVASRTKYGFWVRDGNVFINIRQIERPENLGDINIFKLDEAQKLHSATHADKAVYDGKQWRLDNIRESQFHADGIVTEQKAHTDWSSVLAPNLLNAFVISPENLSAYELSRYIDYLKENGQQSSSVELAFWGRIVNPAVTLVMLLVAAPFVLPVRREVGMGQRIVVGVVIGLGFYLFDRTFGHLGLIYEMNPIFAAFFPTLLALTGALVAIFRLRLT
ncbi:LPS export ABC transporter permease LptG [Methylocaldum sp.]|uniref:LPS export ABC transporter permease LptG n=1 Tax=Methylocaldum sp. TaxID=1969727 RepID=UPI002D601883|nr:LPS export ABC transporter permease LptG [Methylocaldum sp.]HYE34999.1 LPS export ABC transporter permease LptG [Methylocaldum sp.]